MLNDEQFGAMFDTYRPRVYAYAVSRCGLQLAEEVVSETFMVAWRRRDEMPAKAGLPWLLGVARNVTRELYRGELRRAALDEALRVWAEEAGPDVADEVAERATVLRALATLSDADKEVLTLIAWHGLTSAQAAKVVGSTRSAFFVRLHRARRRLEAAMNDVMTTPRQRALVPEEEW
ncbi:RNA polymerase sigma factor [Nonomuraea jiangxiensis]|uniref:RNA polymerase sigma-70 factor, ECF subfamily n=1 Tax=Nonomuraea jiangxiensis TaxID=633440 RepID=A0A1G8ZCC4_9ACTN|nr:RNA polymerase sigma factor [Nonomuraea jiangxiensis]SDK12304.1 RNA polymerase sigma-70 factor, ECF subfamily [Nonomuraea jiangxiensis]